jgi:hypothetical protein
MKKALSRHGDSGARVALTTGCVGMSTRQQRALSGGAIGAAGGAAFGALAGSPPPGLSLVMQ